jgi:hypothetical protein
VGYLEISKVKESCPATRHEGAWEERRCSSYSFFHLALDGGEWSASRPGRALLPGKGPPLPIGQEAGWAPESVWAQRLAEKSSASAGDRTWAPYTLKYATRFLSPIIQIHNTLSLVEKAH